MIKNFLIKSYEALMNRLEDFELAMIIGSRRFQDEIEVDWDAF